MSLGENDFEIRFNFIVMHRKQEGREDVCLIGSRGYGLEDAIAFVTDH